VSTRTLTILAGTLVVVAGLGYARHRYAADDTERGFLTATVDRGPIEATVTATGIVNPVKTVQVGTYVSGPIQAIDVDFNSPVKKDQRVAKIDPASFQSKVQEAQANLQNARAKVDKDRADAKLKKLLLERNRALLEKKLVAQNDLDTAESNYAQAVAQVALDEAGVAQTQAALEDARINLRYTDITSPVDGVVVSRSVDVGQTVAASFQTPTLFLIAEDLTKMQVDTSVSESDVGQVAPDQPSWFTVDAYPGKRFPGKVAQVRNAPITVQNVVTYDVVVAVDNPDLELKPGMTANVTITTAHRDDALRVASRALRFRPPTSGGGETQGQTTVREHAPGSSDGHHSGGGASGAFVVQPDGQLRRVQVRTGIRDNQYVEVLDGELKPGDRVAIGVPRETDAAATPRPPSFAGGGRRF
jgi:HlyD family secretion protein